MKQTPEINFNPKACLASRPFAINKKENGCRGVPVDRVKSYLAEYESIFNSVVLNDSRVSILDPYSVICPGEYCTVMDGERPIYRDDLHLSWYGSKYLASRLKLS